MERALITRHAPLPVVALPAAGTWSAPDPAAESGVVSEPPGAPAPLHVHDDRPGIAMTDLAGTLVSVNDVLLEMWRCAVPGDLLGRPVMDLWEPSATVAELWDALQSEGGCERELASRRRDGTPFCTRVSANVVLGSDGAPARVMVTFVDVTEEKQEEVALREYASELEVRTAELDAYAQTVAHDLSNPLARVIGYAELLENELETFSPQELRQYLRVIADAGRQANTTIKELLLLARVQGPADVQTGPLDMDATVGAVLQRMEFLIDETTPEITLPASWPAVRGYGPWVEHVWENYLSNAFKYGGRPPRVTLGWHQEGGGAQVRFTVTDNGAGIPRDKWPQLFIPFSRLSPRSGSGYGLGLSIARHIVEKLGGRVGLESELGVGSTFWFTLPAGEKPGVVG